MKTVQIRSIAGDIENTGKDNEINPVTLNQAKDLLADLPKNSNMPKEFELRALRDEIRR